MQLNDAKEFSEIMTVVAETFGQQQLSELTLDAYFEILKPFNIADIKRASYAMLGTRKYTKMPTPADFMEHLGGGSLEDQAEVEAGKVLNAIARVGGNVTVVFDDPTTMAVIQNAYGGWPKLCEDCGVEESEKWFRHNFAKAWAAYKRQGIQAFGTLPGRHEIANTAGGHTDWIPEPRLVGDQARAQKVLEMGPQEAPRQLAGGAVSFASAVRRMIPAEETLEFEQ